MLVDCGRAGGSKAEEKSIEQGVMEVSSRLRERFITIVAPASSAAEIPQRESIRECC
jgi:hypothetical protein